MAILFLSVQRSSVVKGVVKGMTSFQFFGKLNELVSTKHWAATAVSRIYHRASMNMMTSTVTEAHQKRRISPGKYSTGEAIHSKPHPEAV